MLNDAAFVNYNKLNGTIIGKYKILEVIIENCAPSKIRCKVECLKCGWKGILSLRTIYKVKNSKGVKCSHQGGNTIHPGDVFGKYIVIKKAPAKLCNNDLLVPYYTCRCTKCDSIVKVTKSTLYATKGRNINNVCRHENVVQ